MTHAPLILSTWSFGQRANRAAWPILEREGASIDAVEAACRDAEGDPDNHTVGYGGYPDRSGRVSLDASIMLAPRACGSVAFVRHFKHPITIARRVMDRTPHVLLAGDGAEAFAREQGLEEAELLTETSRAAWEKWRAQQPVSAQGGAASAAPEARPVRNVEELGLRGSDRGDGGGSASGRKSHSRGTGSGTPAGGESDHDTIGVLARDARGVLAGGCTTSGLAFKIPGRVGDSPIIGHGLYVDPTAGAAVATGHGELVMGVCGSFLAVELMRSGLSPAEAAALVIERIAASYELTGQDQVGIIALHPTGRWSAASLRPGFRIAVRTQDQDELVEPQTVLLREAR